MKICLVCSHGGHLTEMQMLGPTFDGHECSLVTTRCTRTEGMTVYERVYLLPRIGTSLWRMFKAFIQAFGILVRERPGVVISTGAEIAIPFCWVGKVLGAKIVFVESWCRIHTRSGTGLLVYPVADLLLVQWPTLLKEYGSKARYEEGLV